MELGILRGPGSFIFCQKLHPPVHPPKHTLMSGGGNEPVPRHRVGARGLQRRRGGCAGACGCRGARCCERAWGLYFLQAACAHAALGGRLALGRNAGGGFCMRGAGLWETSGGVAKMQAIQAEVVPSHTPHCSGWRCGGRRRCCERVSWSRCPPKPFTAWRPMPGTRRRWLHF